MSEVSAEIKSLWKTFRKSPVFGVDVAVAGGVAAEEREEEEDAAMKEEDAAKRGDEDVEIVETDAGAYIFSFLYN